MINFEKLKQRGISPISENAPYGDDPRTTSEFKVARSVIGRYGDLLTKNTDADPDEPKEWVRAIENCATVLNKHGKDMRVLSWLCGALVNIYGIRGLTAGLEIFRHFLEDDPEALYPAGVRPKVNAFSWFGEFVEFALRKYSKFISSDLDALDNAEAQAVTALYKEIDVFYDVANEKLLDDSYDFKSLKNSKETIQSLHKLAKSRMSVVDEDDSPPVPPPVKPEVKLEVFPIPKPEKRSEPQPEPPQRPAPTPPRPIVEEPKQPDKISLIRDLSALAFKMRRVAPQEALAFQLLRLAKWSLVSNLPPTLPKTKRTRLIGPRTEFNILNARNKRLAKNESFDHLAFIETCEQWFNKYPFWLDLQHIIYESADLKKVDKIKEIIVEETRRVFRRLGEKFMELEFKDGTPFANEATRNWLKSILAEGDGGVVPASVLQVMEPPPKAKPVPSPLTPAKPTVVLSMGKSGIELDGFIQERFKEISSGKASDALTALGVKLSTVTAPLDRWRLLRVCGLAAAALPAKKLFAITLLRQCRELGEKLTVSVVQPNEFSEVLLALRDLGDMGDAGLIGLKETEMQWIAITTKALNSDPAAVLRHEMGRSKS